MTGAAAAPRPLTVALVGRPNAGKTSVLMHLSGGAQRPVNFPGSSVERVESTIRVGERQLTLVDLPGIVSLAPNSPDEHVTLDYLRREGDDGPDLLCAVLDAAKLTVELQLLERLAELGRPVVVVLTKNDVARSHGVAVDVEALRTLAGVPVVEVNGFTGAGAEALRELMVHGPGAAVPRHLPGGPDGVARRVQGIGTRRARTFSDRIDAVVLHRWLGLPLLGLVMLAMFQLVYTVAEPFMGWIEAGQEGLSALVADSVAPGALRSFLIDGLINGVGSIVVFVPQIALLVAFVTLLEGSGYMARAAFLLDRLLRRFGLSGRSFVPLTTSFACAIPGILASRIIDDERDRLATIAVSPLMSCSARLPVYVVLIGAFFPPAWAGLVLVGLYALGIATAVLVATVLRRTVLRGGRSMLMMELPVYQRPSWRLVGRQVGNACRQFAVTAGTIIFATAVVIWALSYYPRPASVHESLDAPRSEARALPDGERERALERLAAAERAAYLEQSYLARAGKFVQPVMEPAGFDWRLTVGVLAAFPARELIVPTLGVLYSLGDVDPGEYDLSELGRRHDASGLRGAIRNATDEQGRRVMSPLVALALMAFFALCSQCMATLGAIRRETGSWRWPLFTFGYMTVLAWAVAVAIYQGGRLLGFGA